MIHIVRGVTRIRRNEKIACVFLVNNKMSDDDSDCRLILRKRCVGFYIRYPYLVIENTDFKMSFLLTAVRFSLVLPERKLILFDQHNRIQLEFDDVDDVDTVMKHVQGFRTDPKERP